MFDMFNAELRCRACGAERISGHGAIQTKLPVVNRLRSYGVGDAIEIPDTAEGIVNSGYYLGDAEVESLDDLWFLHHWICVCQMDNAVLIHIRDGRIVETESTPLGGESLRRAHFLESEIGTEVLRRVYMREYPDADEREVRATQWDELLDDVCSGRDDDSAQ